MTKNLDNNGLRSIVENYDIFYIDLWGVVHNGITLHKNAIETLEEITKANKDYVLLTNAPRPNKVVKTILEKMGMSEGIRDKVYSSGEASLGYLKKTTLINLFIILDSPEILICFQILKKINLKISKIVNIYYVQGYLKNKVLI